MYERQDGSWDMDREEADYQQAELIAAGREAYRRDRKSLACRLKGDLAGASAICSHGASGLVDGLPTCARCGSTLDEARRAVVAPCVHPHGCLKCFSPLVISDGRGKCGNGHDWYLKTKAA